jgi:NADH-quinone oxidoreductase subunit I
MLQSVFKGIVEFPRAMAVTLRYLFTKPITVQFPEEPVQVYPRFRARHELQRHPDGLEKCVACGLCAAVCPANVIFVQAAENTPEERHSPGERYAEKYELNMSRCIFCGYCQEACPTGAIVLKHDFCLADTSRESFIYTKDRLLQPATPRVVVLED